jgi:FkbM family methyltransferase
MSIASKVAGFRAVLFFDNWPVLVVQRMFDRNTGLVVYRKKQLEFVVDHKGGDENGTRQCLTSDMYKKYLTSFSLPDRARTLDLGANGGGFPLMLRAEGIGIEKAVCVEMNPMVANRLKLNLATNFGPEAVAINAAVCDTSDRKEIVLRHIRGGTSISILHDQADRTTDSDSVRTISLATLCEEYFDNGPIDICKVDIEGAEYEAFESSNDAVLLTIRYLLVELHEPSRTPRFVERLSELGFADITRKEDSKTGDKTEVRCFKGPAA